MSDGHEGNSLLINPNHILAIYETSRDVAGKSKTIEMITNIYSTTQERWEVKESLENVYKLIAEYNLV